MRIDAHQHFWVIGANGHEWPDADWPAIHCDFLPADVAPLMDAVGVDAGIAVQSQPNDADTDWLSALAAGTPRIAALVGWADLWATDAPARIAALAARPKLRGLRPMLQDMAAHAILDPAAGPALAAMAAHGLVFDALVRPRHLKAIARIADAHPTLSIVIDHIAKPDIAGAVREPWASDIAALASRPNVACKLSGIPTEARPGYKREDLAFCVDHVVTAFGPERLLWGSDWPVLLLAADYARWHGEAEALLGRLDDEARAAVFGGNAARIYRIG